MEPLDQAHALASVLEDIRTWLDSDVFTLQVLLQVPALLLTSAAAWLVAYLSRDLCRRVLRSVAVDSMQEAFFERAVLPLTFPAFWCFGLVAAVLVAREIGWPFQLADITFTLVLVWLFIRFAAALLPDSPWTKLIAAVAWPLAALSILDLLAPLIGFLGDAGITVGETHVTLLTVLTAMAVFALMLWLSTIGSRLLERRIQRLPSLEPSTKVLFGKITKITLILLAVALSLGALGIDVTALAVFSGAIGVGIGFGLQKTVSNLFSGIILLMDRSIRPGDIIEVGGTFGWVASLGARYVEIETRDGTEFLIPNEDIITKQVINWTHQDNKVRLKLPVRVSYDTDLRQALRLMAEAAQRPSRVLSSPAPNPLVIGFGENSVDLELRFWISDVSNGVHNISSDVLLEVWDAFRRHGIKVPLPQRDVRVHALPPLAVAVPA